MKLKSELEMRIEHLRGIIRDIGDQGSAGVIDDTDVWAAEQTLNAIERGETPDRTEREKIDNHLGIHRSQTD